MLSSVEGFFGDVCWDFGLGGFAVRPYRSVLGEGLGLVEGFLRGWVLGFRIW